MREGWELKRLGEVVDFLRGLTYSKNDEVDYSENIVLRSNNIDLLTNTLDLSDLKHINSQIEIAENKYVRKGSLIICTANGSKNHLGKVALIEEDYKYAFGGFMGLITPKSGLDSKYLFYLMISENYKKFIQAMSDGANINNLKFSDLGEFEIPIPPLSEQQRIVSILDTAFAAIAKAKANAEQNLRNARELFESYLQGVFEKKGEGWEEKRLKDLTSKIGSGATPRGGQENYKSEGIHLVRSMNVHDLNFSERNIAFIDEKQAKELNGVTLQENDVLLNITGASVARCCVFPRKYIPARVNQHVAIIRPIKEILDASFLNLLLVSKPYKDQLLFTGEQGATRQAINKAQIESFKIALPSIEIQQSIVRRLDALRAETQRLEAAYEQKLADLEELKKSILQKAFAGELDSSAVAQTA
jgi:type I restriction enzyme S subunit